MAESQSDLEAAKLLISSLGTFQVEVVQRLEDVARSVHTVICLTPMPEEEAPCGATLLYLDDTADFSPNPQTYGDSSRSTTYVPSSQEGRLPKAGDGLLQAAFWMDQRLFKASNPLEAADLKLWILVCEIGLGLGENSTNLWESISARITRLNARKNDFSIKARTPSSASAEIFLRALPQKYRRRIRDANTAQLMHQQSLGQILTSMADSISLMTFTIYIWLQGLEAPLRESVQILRSPGWSHPATSFPRLARNSQSFAYSPVTLLWLNLVFIYENPECNLNETPLYLKKFSSGGSPSMLASNPAASSVRLSHSAWKLWRSLHQMPSIEGRQILLTSDSYSALLHDLQAYWTQVFRSIQHHKRRVFCSVWPWPSQLKAAISLRFDVDRRLTEEQVRNVISTQQRRLPVPSGSWYFWANDPTKESWRAILESEGQEVGIHCLKAEEAEPGIGVTHHSAPTSEYWQGEVTMKTLNKNGAIYGEFLGNLVPTPRPMLIPAAGGVRVQSDTFFTGPGFPLEGSTADTNLDFFDKLLHRFHEQLRRGGHAVITTHPDLNMNLLDELLQREELDNVWIASTNQVVARLRQLHKHGSLHSSTHSTGIEIWSQSSVVDVQIFVEAPGKSETQSWIGEISPNGCFIEA